MWADKLNFDNYALGRIEQHTCNYNWKTFIEVYLEDYHVAPFHPGLSGFVTCDDLAWQFGEHYSVQTVGVFNQLAKPGSPAYQKWHDEVLKYQNGAPPARRDLAHLLPKRHGRMVSQHARGLHTIPAGIEPNAERGRILLPRRHRRV